MLDKHIVPIIKPPLRKFAEGLQRAGITADSVTVAGFVIGILAAIMVVSENYFIALILLLLNRLADGVDGELARLQKPTDAGGFLDITLDFIFYAIFPLSFAFANVYINGLAEGTETVICFALMCLLPGYFAVIAYLFAFICVITAINRVVFGYRTLNLHDSVALVLFSEDVKPDHCIIHFLCAYRVGELRFKQYYLLFEVDACIGYLV